MALTIMRYPSTRNSLTDAHRYAIRINYRNIADLRFLLPFLFHSIRQSACYIWIIAATILFTLSETAVAINVNLSTGDLHYIDSQGNSMPYRLYLPPGYNTPDAKFPLILYLHGAGDNGTNNIWPSAPPTAPTLIDNLYNTAHGNMGEQYKAFLLVPQTTSEWSWNDYGPDYVGQDMAMSILNLIVSTYHVDTSRLYITGLSMGGGGTFDFIAHYPSTFAAAAPLSGWGDTSTASIIKDIPIWAYHGVADTVVPVSETDAMFDAVEADGGNMEYTRPAGVGHGGWETFYDGSTYKNSKGQTFYQWMFAQSLPVPEPSSISLATAAIVLSLFCFHRQQQRCRK